MNISEGFRLVSCEDKKRFFMKGKQMSKDRTVRIGDKVDGKREYGE